MRWNIATVTSTKKSECALLSQGSRGFLNVSIVQSAGRVRYIFFQEASALFELSEFVVVDPFVLAVEKLTSVQELDKWICLKPQEVFTGPRIVHVRVDEITSKEKLLLERTRFSDNITPSRVDALVY